MGWGQVVEAEDPLQERSKWFCVTMIAYYGYCTVVIDGFAFSFSRVLFSEG